MKKIAIMLIAAASMAAMPTFAAEMTKTQKDQCLLSSKNCADQAMSIQKKIKTLQSEIKKGKKVYTAEELKTLNNKLTETETFLDNMLKNP